MEFVVKKLNYQITVHGVANVHFFNFEQNFDTKMDKHAFSEIVFVSSGELMIESENYTGKLTAGQMIIHSENEAHRLYTISEVEPTVIIIGFKAVGFNNAYFSKQPLSLSDANIKRLAEIVKEGRNVFAPPHNVPIYNMKKNTHQPYGSEQMLKILLEYFLISITREYSLNYIPPVATPSTFTITEILNYLNDKFKEKITINELSFIFGTNRTTLCKEFKQATGTTITEYLAVKKLELAKKHIANTTETFTEISNQLNFESIHYFTRFFKKRTGMSPKEYRKKYLNKIDL